MDQQASAFYLGVGTRTISRLAANGTLVPVKLLNRTRLFDREDLDHLVDVVKASQ